MPVQVGSWLRCSGAAAASGALPSDDDRPTVVKEDLADGPHGTSLRRRQRQQTAEQQMADARTTPRRTDVTYYKRARAEPTRSDRWAGLRPHTPALPPCRSANRSATRRGTPGIASNSRLRACEQDGGAPVAAHIEEVAVRVVDIHNHLRLDCRDAIGRARTLRIDLRRGAPLFVRRIMPQINAEREPRRRSAFAVDANARPHRQRRKARHGVGTGQHRATDGRSHVRERGPTGRGKALRR
jgi:hypothetical protein